MKGLYHEIIVTTTALLTIGAVTSFSPASLTRRRTNNVAQVNLYGHRNLHQQTTPTSLTATPETTTATSNDPIDHAPCFDSVCDSEAVTPVSTATSPGTATLRLGPNSSPTVWTEFGRLATANPGVANLGQGFPDWLPPRFCVDALVEGVTDVGTRSPHQYTRTAGHGSLVKQLAERYSRHLGKTVDPMAEVAVTVGASQALFVSLQTLIKPGDEVILFEPFFDLYVNQIKLAGGTPVYVPLTFQPYTPDDPDTNFLSGGEWVLEPKLLREKITPNTRAILLNSPHNPTGKIFSREEMESIADALLTVADERCVVLSDEVYKYIVHSDPSNEPTNGHAEHTNGDAPSPITCQGHVHFASLPSMYSRTITISSAGKTFSATGWQVGWAVGPPHLLSPMHQLLPYVQFCASTVLQEALARALPRADLPYRNHPTYYDHTVKMYTRKRDVLLSALRDAGFGVPDYDRTAGGGFFIFARITPAIRAAIPEGRIGRENPACPGGKAGVDWALCEWMAEEKGILCIPATPFFSEERRGEAEGFVRVAFCKQDEVLGLAAERLGRLFEEVEGGEVEGVRVEVQTVS